MLDFIVWSEQKMYFSYSILLKYSYNIIFCIYVSFITTNIKVEKSWKTTLYSDNNYFYNWWRDRFYREKTADTVALNHRSVVGKYLTWRIIMRNYNNEFVLKYVCQ